MLEANKIFNGSAEFLFGAADYEQIPKNHFPEIGFLGASNVGKSSLINAVLNQKVAIVSSTPGRTRQINFFKLGGYKDGFMIVDMPGYGFAKAQESQVNQWRELSFKYLINRPNLKRLFLLLDPEKGLKQNDIEVIQTLCVYAVSFQIIITKTDKVSLEKTEILRSELLSKAPEWVAMHPKILTSSSSKGYGIREIRGDIMSLLEGL